MPTEGNIPGLIIRAQSGFFSVQTAGAVLTCQLRGRLKQGPRLGDLAAVGDRVQVTPLADGTGMIESIEARRHALIRLDPRPRGVYQQVILANPDQAVFVFACANPSPHMRMLDRFLVIAEKQGIPAIIVANKIDLVALDQAEAMFGYYPSLGYPVIYASVKSGAGVELLRAQLMGKVSALAGPSGVGKSSLLNAIQPGLGLAVREVSAAINKGKHTTNVRQLFPLEAETTNAGTTNGSIRCPGGYVADSPGMRSLALWDTEPEELDGYFPEIASRVAQCQFNDCSHSHEPGCAVRAAVADGLIRPERYESYMRLRAGDD
ncbi:MAG: ribosome small subunit-dependent GTPase A [Anaerolineales bacterium]|nr:ribosome small subunit-dependent GTPase A [Anaerolineales bacterium]